MNNINANEQRSPEDLAWTLGCLIWRIFNHTSDSEDFLKVDNLPEQLQGFYKKCLAKNKLKRPNINDLQQFLISSIRSGPYFP